MALNKIITGNSDGVEQAARDVAIGYSIGWIEDGQESGNLSGEDFQLSDDANTGCQGDTKDNLDDCKPLADGLLILSCGQRANRIDTYRKLALKHCRKLLHLDLSQRSITDGAGLICSWITFQHLRVLQVTGPNETAVPGIYQHTKRVLALALIEAVVGLDLELALDGIESSESSDTLQTIPTSVEAAADELIKEMSLRQCVMIARLGDEALDQQKYTLAILIQDQLGFWMKHKRFRRVCQHESNQFAADDYDIACLLFRTIRHKLHQTHRLRLIG